jgi:cytochrome c5
VSSGQDDTFSPKNLAVLGSLLFVALILGESVFSRHGGETGSTGVGSLDDIAMRLEPVVTLASVQASATSSTSGGTDEMSPRQLYDGACMACHASGVAGAPKLDDTAAWQGRMGSGIDGLLSSAISGKGAMPPKGGSTYSDDQLRSVIEFMLGEAGL